MTLDPVMSLKGVVKTRPGGTGYKLVVDDLSIEAKERVALIGDSGSGKSTILDIMALVLKPDSAEELYIRPGAGPEREDLWRDWATGRHGRFEGIRRSDLGYVLQTGGLLPFLTVRDNIALPAGLKGGAAGREAAGYLGYLAGELKIEHLLKKYPTKISVGERQRCAIARALIHKPALVLADEPTASLDPVTADKVFELLLTLCSDCALVVSTHEHRRVLGGGFRVYRLTTGAEEPGGPIVARVVPPDCDAREGAPKAGPRVRLDKAARADSGPRGHEPPAA